MLKLEFVVFASGSSTTTTSSLDSFILPSNAYSAERERTALCASSRSVSLPLLEGLPSENYS